MRTLTAIMTSQLELRNPCKGDIPMFRTTKAIAYSFPTSPNAKALGFNETGCFHISLCHVNIENSGQSTTFIPHNAEGFLTADDKDLIAIFQETEGDICPYFKRHGDAKALAAIAQAEGK